MSCSPPQGLSPENSSSSSMIQSTRMSRWIMHQAISHVQMGMVGLALVSSSLTRVRLWSLARSCHSLLMKHLRHLCVCTCCASCLVVAFTFFFFLVRLSRTFSGIFYFILPHALLPQRMLCPFSDSLVVRGTTRVNTTHAYMRSSKPEDSDVQWGARRRASWQRALLPSWGIVF